MQPEHQGRCDIPFAAVEPDAWIAKPPKEENGEADDGYEAGDAADHHREELMSDRTERTQIFELGRVRW